MRLQKSQKQINYYNVILLIIIVIATIVRLWKLGSVPFMHDEFSALIRTGYDNFYDLIHDGVMLNDMHPAGVQVFLYFWVKIFGWNELWLKLPFALMGVASVYLTYVIANQWFNKNIGLLSAAVVSVSQLFVLYSQLIRPYTPGLFFILLLVYFWNNILFSEKRPTFGTYAGFALSAFCAAEIHMFSTAQAGLIALTGLLFFKNLEIDRKKAYLWSCAAAVILYLPTFPIFYHQFFVEGGLAGWLARPKTDFLVTFLSYTLNYSDVFIFTVLIALLLPFILQKSSRDGRISIRIISFCWFLIPFLIAFVYSLLRQPIIQYSTLLFSFPFLIIAVFSFFDEKISVKTIGIVVGLILLTGVTSLIFDRQYYKQFYQQGFDQVAVEMLEEREKYADDIEFIAYSSRPEMVEHYQHKYGLTDVKNFNEDSDIVDYQRFIKNSNKDIIGVGLTDHAKMNFELLAVAEYPYLVDEKAWFTTRYLTLTKNDNGKPLLHVLKENVKIDHGNEWTEAVYLPADFKPMEDRVGFIADIQALDTINRIVFVVEIIDSQTKESLLWTALEEKNRVIMPDEKVRLVDGFFIPDIDMNGREFKVYVWNVDKKALIINSISFYKAKNGPYFYGLYNPV